MTLKRLLNVKTVNVGGRDGDRLQRRKRVLRVGHLRWTDGLRQSCFASKIRYSFRFFVGQLQLLSMHYILINIFLFIASLILNLKNWIRLIRRKKYRCGRVGGYWDCKCNSTIVYLRALFYCIFVNIINRKYDKKCFLTPDLLGSWTEIPRINVAN